MSFIYYDTETTGTSSAFDQILQFAAIRTDEHLNVLERFEIRSRLQPRIVASPGALRVTGLTVSHLLDPTLPSHYEMVCAIRAKLISWSPAVFIGYNSMQFDEHFLRSALWKTLHNPYLTNRHGNGRADALLLAQATVLRSPDVLAVPQDAKGKPTLRLDRLAPANGFDHANAHDAMADVEVTIHLCRHVAEHAPDVWSNFLRFAQKAAVADFVDSEEVFGMAEYYFGRPSTFAVTMIGRSQANPGEMYVFDLANDPAAVAALDEIALARRLSESPKLVRRIKTNAAPILTPIEDAPRPSSGTPLSLDELSKRARALRSIDGLAARIVSAFERSKVEKSRSLYVEEQIYDGFASGDDEARLEAFHQVPWPERPPIARSLVDARLRHLALRLIFDEHASALSHDERQHLEQELRDRLGAAEAGVPWCTWSAAIVECERLLVGSSPDEQARLSEYQRFCEERVAEIGG